MVLVEKGSRGGDKLKLETFLHPTDILKRWVPSLTKGIRICFCRGRGFLGLLVVKKGRHLEEGSSPFSSPVTRGFSGLR